MNGLSELEEKRSEYFKQYEILDSLSFKIYIIYNELFDKLKKELPINWEISFITDEDLIVFSHFEISDNTNINVKKHIIKYKGVTYNLIGNENNKDKINKIIDDFSIIKEKDNK